MSGSAELAELSLRAMARDSGAPLADRPASLDVRLHGQGISGHAIGVEEAIRILSPLQQALSSIGQSLATVPTASGKIPEVRCGDDAEETVVRHLTKGHGDQAPSARRHSTRR